MPSVKNDAIVNSNTGVGTDAKTPLLSADTTKELPNSCLPINPHSDLPNLLSTRVPALVVPAVIVAVSSDLVAADEKVRTPTHSVTSAASGASHGSNESKKDESFKTTAVATTVDVRSLHEFIDNKSDLNAKKLRTAIAHWLVKIFEIQVRAGHISSVLLQESLAFASEIIPPKEFINIDVLKEALQLNVMNWFQDWVQLEQKTEQSVANQRFNKADKFTAMSNTINEVTDFCRVCKDEVLVDILKYSNDDYIRIFSDTEHNIIHISNANYLIRLHENFPRAVEDIKDILAVSAPFIGPNYYFYGAQNPTGLTYNLLLMECTSILMSVYKLLKNIGSISSVNETIEHTLLSLLVKGVIGFVGVATFFSDIVVGLPARLQGVTGAVYYESWQLSLMLFLGSSFGTLQAIMNIPTIKDRLTIVFRAFVEVTYVLCITNPLLSFIIPSSQNGQPTFSDPFRIFINLGLSILLGGLFIAKKYGDLNQQRQALQTAFDNKTFLDPIIMQLQFALNKLNKKINIYSGNPFAKLADQKQQVSLISNPDLETLKIQQQQFINVIAALQILKNSNNETLRAKLEEELRNNINSKYDLIEVAFDIGVLAFTTGLLDAGILPNGWYEVVLASWVGTVSATLIGLVMPPKPKSNPITPIIEDLTNLIDGRIPQNEDENDEHQNRKCCSLSSICRPVVACLRYIGIFRPAPSSHASERIERNPQGSLAITSQVSRLEK